MVGRTRGARLAVAATLVAGLALVAGCSGSVDSPATDNVRRLRPVVVLLLVLGDADAGRADHQPRRGRHRRPAHRARRGQGHVRHPRRGHGHRRQGREVAGKLGSDGTWTSSARLAPSAAYTVSATATGEDGSPSTTTSTFTTLKPKVTATYGILNSGETVGVGMPASIQFDSAVTTAALRAEVEKLVKVTTSPPKQSGAWGWLDNRQLMWRPAKYWKPGTKVTISAPLTGVQTGEGKWVANDDNASFTVGPR